MITYFFICIAVGLLEYAMKIGLLFYLYCLFTGVLFTDRFYTDSLFTDRFFTDRLFTAQALLHPLTGQTLSTFINHESFIHQQLLHNLQKNGC